MLCRIAAQHKWKTGGVQNSEQKIMSKGHDWMEYVDPPTGVENGLRIKKKYTFAGCELKIEAKTNRVIYEYKVEGGMHFCFDLLSHVGAPYQPYFEAIIEENKLDIELYDNPEDSYCHGYYERLRR